MKLWNHTKGLNMTKFITITILTLTLGACANVGSGSSTIGSNGAINSPTANPRAASTSE